MRLGQGFSILLLLAPRLDNSSWGRGSVLGIAELEAASPASTYSVPEATPPPHFSLFCFVLAALHGVRDLGSPIEPEPHGGS